MHREGDIIHFGPVDASRCPGLGLGAWLPVEAVPGLLDQLTERQAEAQATLAVANDLPVTAHYRKHEMAAAHRQLHDLEALEIQLSREALEEYIGFKVDRLLQGLGIEVLQSHDE